MKSFMNKIGHFIVVMLILLNVSCISKKKTAGKFLPGNENSVKRENSVLSTLKMNSNSLSYYSAEAEAAYKDKQQNLQFSSQIVFERDKYVWMSITALLGIEVARVMITPDSIKILDRFNRTYISSGYAYIKKFTQLPITFEQLQNLLCGNALFEEKANLVSLDSNAMSYFLMLNATQFSQTSTYSKSSFKNEEVSIDDLLRGQNMRVSYKERNLSEAPNQPSSIAINITGEKNIECHFKLSNFVLVKNKEPQFVVPKTYKTIVY